jgi:hypothetical protein
MNLELAAVNQVGSDPIAVVEIYLIQLMHSQKIMGVQVLVDVLRCTEDIFEGGKYESWIRFSNGCG